MTVESFRWLATPGCGVAAFLLLYDTHRALRPRIAGEQPWRESRVLGMATLVLGTLVLQRLDGPAWMNGAIPWCPGDSLVRCSGARSPCGGSWPTSSGSIADD